MRIPGRRTGVSAIISTLMIIAIAVALSAALFVSATGYLSSLVSGGSNQQPNQNRAEESLLTIENWQAVAYTSGYPTDGYVLLYVRNVGGTTVTLGSLTVTAPPTNGGLTHSFSSVLAGSTWSAVGSSVLVSSETTATSYCGLAGTATGGSSNSLVDGGANWSNVQWNGYVVTVTSGASAGSTATISSNTQTTLTVSSWSHGAPASGMGYAINPPSTLTTLAIQQTGILCITWSHGASPVPAHGDAFQVQVSSTVGTSNIVTVNVP